MPQLLRAAAQRVPRSGSQRRRKSCPVMETLEDRTLLNAGMLDPTFGTAGQVITPVANSTGVIALVLQPDGKLVAAGDSGANLVLERYNSDGTADPTFGSGGQVNANLGLGVAGLALQTDGKILVAGTGGDFLHNSLHIVVARFLADGTLDSTFGSAGEVTVGSGLQGGLITDGKIVVAGMTLSMGTTIQSVVVARLNSNGTADTAFGSNGLASTFINGDVVPIPHGLGIEPNGRIVVTTTSELVGFASNGSLDASFGAAGITKMPQGTSIEGLTILTDGRIIAVGSGVGANGTSDFAILRFFANGNLDNSFGSNGETLTDFDQGESANAVAVQPDGRYVAAGSTVFADVISFALVRYNPDGSLDTSFGNGGKAIAFPTLLTVSSSSAHQVLVQPDGRAVAAGDASSGSFALARFTADTPLPAANQRFVAQAYLDLLGRPVDGAGLAQWSGLLDRGTSRTQVALDIEFSPEYTGRTVNALYAQYLHRTADPGGLSNSVNFLRSGGTIEQLIDILVSSPEFIQGQGKGSADGFLDALYQDGLDRAVDPGGRAGWKQALANGASFAQVAAAILASPEYRQDIVTAAYELFLRREPDVGGLTGFTAALGQGARDEQVFAVIVGSPEYFQRTQGVA
jgi:uncharacterized delta-60 repeat protein